MQFVKMHGLGNDFILMEDSDKSNLAAGSELAIKLCDRHTGVGADGLVFILPSAIADSQMRIFNPDGSEPEMCGNAIRCFARYLYDRNIVSKDNMTIETLAGIKVCRLIKQENGDILVEVDMGEPELERNRIPMLGDPGRVIAEPLQVDQDTYKVTCVSMGNPHCLIYVDKADEFPVAEIGPKVEKHPVFPNKTNVEFLQIINPKEIRMRVWERGAGITMACGTGACATAVGSHLNGFTDRQVTVHLDGGDLSIRYAENNRVYMTGPATYVFEGKILD